MKINKMCRIIIIIIKKNVFNHRILYAHIMYCTKTIYAYELQKCCFEFSRF